MAKAGDLLDRFPELLRLSREGRIEDAVDSGLYAVEEVKAEHVDLLLEEVIRFFREVSEAYSDGEGRLAHQSVSDLSFLGGLELKKIADSYSDAREQNRVWDILRYADMGAARSEEALLALEIAIREAEGLTVRNPRELDLEPALEVRRQYAILRHELAKEGEPKGEELREALEQALERLSALRDHPSYRWVRVDDRLLIRQLQKRIGATVAEDDPEAWERLWEDLNASGHLLMQINRREVLQRHDVRLLGAVGTSPEARRHLAALLGRDPELDRILLDEGDPSEEAVEALKRRLFEAADD